MEFENKFNSVQLRQALTNQNKRKVKCKKREKAERKKERASSKTWVNKMNLAPFKYPFSRLLMIKIKKVEQLIIW